VGRIIGLVLGALVLAVTCFAVGVLYNTAHAPTPEGADAPTAAALAPTAKLTATPSPTPTPQIVTSGTVIRQMQAVQRLETTRYTIETVVEATTTPANRFSSGEKLLLIAHGTVIVGFDLAKLATGDVTVSPDGKAVTVTLPAVEIFSSGLDESKTRIYSRDSGRQLAVFPKDPDPNLESEARRRGLAQIVQTACDDGITERATKDGTGAMQDLLTLAGFTSVQVRVKESTKPLCSGGNATPQP
jgi:hypothetical protein